MDVHLVDVTPSTDLGFAAAAGLGRDDACSDQPFAATDRFTDR
jgi:hypothetical protein